ncbi:MAG TPA: hypothetical protein VM577_08215 [Anaerovoracaceae bacterium]|nr:hypothetical protein [Anaerovoracaceae bacterium]
MSNNAPSLREKIKIYKSKLTGDQLAEFNRIFNDKKETMQLQKAFVLAKEACEKVQKD